MLASMAEILLLDYPVWLILYIYLAFLISGTIKGILGIGLPAVFMSAATLFIPPIEAIPLLVLPIVLSNFYQCYRAGEMRATAQRYSVFAIVSVVIMSIIAFNITHYPSDLLLGSIGIAMVLLAINTLFGVPLRLGANPLWQGVFGIVTGIIGGLSAIWSPPVVMYLMARNVDKDEFIRAVGFLFMVGAIALLLTFGSTGLITIQILAQSVIGLLMVLAGFRLGEYFRTKINTTLFRKLILWAFLVFGLRLIAISVF